MKILIAEDDMTSRRILTVLMTAWGFEVEAVANGAAALAALSAPDGPRLALLDWMMPQMTGVDVCRRLRESEAGRGIYLILITSREDKEDVTRALRSGANDYVTKPYDSDELAARVEVGKRMIGMQSELSQRIAELGAALEEIKTLQGLIPICMHCHKIRDQGDAWQGLENYIEANSAATFTHGLCPDCLEEHYPEPEPEPEPSRGSDIEPDDDCEFEIDLELDLQLDIDPLLEPELRALAS